MRKRMSDNDDELSPLLPQSPTSPGVEIQLDLGGTKIEEGGHIKEEMKGQNITGTSSSSRWKSVFEFLKNVLRHTTLEPMLFLKMMAESNFGVVADTLEIDRICRINLNFSENDCRDMDDGNHKEIQLAVQRYQNTFNYHQNLMDSLLPLLIVIFMGSLSDKYGRKPPMLAVLAGFVSSGSIYLLTSLNPSWPVEVLYVATFSADIFGSWVLFNMAVYSYVADITVPENRTKRLGILDSMWYLGGPIGRLLGGWLFKIAGYFTVFLLSAGLWVVCFMYVLLLVRETVDTDTQREVIQEVHDARWGPLRHVVALVRTAFKSRPGNGRVHLLVLLALKVMVYSIQGHQMYLWARLMFGWGPAEFNTWTSIDSVIHQAGMLLWVWVAEKLHLHDTIVASGGVTSIAMWSVVLACISSADLWWLVIVASVLGMLESSIEPALRTLLTVVAGAGEAGKVLALNGLLEAAWLAVDRSLYTFLYNTYVGIFPQINFVVQASLCVVIVIVLLILWKTLSISNGLQPSQIESQIPVHGTGQGSNPAVNPIYSIDKEQDHTMYQPSLQGDISPRYPKENKQHEC